MLSSVPSKEPDILASYRLPGSGPDWRLRQIHPSRLLSRPYVSIALQIFAKLAITFPPGSSAIIFERIRPSSAGSCPSEEVAG